ncbi:class II glutamine amidotransferase [Alicyclobacillus acidiphilus]|uniref:class II glutamine amidotransferase n=1 Tax=Alicyclobacillus acidiphilus TaxID=182455 RepID=UPI0008331A80|nr:hypothetical protein [Alicyclobacillus acidiphilus]
MCEILYVRASNAFYLADVLPIASQIEHYGIAGFGWGVAWVTPAAELRHFRSAGRLETEYEHQMRLAKEQAMAVLFHLRRPSFLSTLQVRNSQPYLEPGKFAFAHNGYLENHKAYRETFSGEFQGESDSEVGFLLYRKYLETLPPVEALTKAVDDSMGSGEANVVILNADGSAVALGRNTKKNPLHQFEGNGWTGIVTELHSPDGSLFRMFPWMTSVSTITEAVEINKALSVSPVLSN